MKTARTSMATIFVLLASRTIPPTARAFTPSIAALSSRNHNAFSTAAASVASSRFATATTTMNATTGPRQAQLEERLTETFAPIFLEVQNTSHGQKSDESHFKVVVVSEAFEGTRLVGRHRAINKAVAESDGSLGFHSLEIGAAKTPTEWDKNSNVAPSPKCKGGDGRGP